MSWIDGSPSLKKNFSVATGGGQPIGRMELFSGVYSIGINCLSCRKIILEWDFPA